MNAVFRCIKSALEQSGVDISIFKTHSTHSASVSKAAAAGVSVAEKLHSAGWRNDLYRNLPLHILELFSRGE